jgi:hypothetical protein
LANTKTLTVLIADIREQADIEDLTDRHPDAQLIKWINLEWRLLRTKLADAGMPGLATPTSIAALPTSAPVATEQFLEVSWPDGAVGVYGIDVLISTRWVPLEPISFARRRDFQSGSSTASESVPGYWLPLTLPAENTTTITAGKIALYPLASGAASYRIWYLPVWVDITTGANVFYGHDVWFDWLIQGVVRRVAQKDDDAQNTLTEAIRRQGEAWDLIKRSILHMNLAQPIKRVRASRTGRNRWGA